MNPIYLDYVTDPDRPFVWQAYTRMDKGGIVQATADMRAKIDTMSLFARQELPRMKCPDISQGHIICPLSLWPFGF